MDVLTLIHPLMTSPFRYPLLTLLPAADGVAPIIPSEAVVLAAGVLSHGNYRQALFIIACVATGLFIGDHVAYTLCRSVLSPSLIRRSRRLARAVDTAAEKLEKRGNLLIITSRFLPGGRTTLNVACGMTHLPLAKFTPASAIAAVAWSIYIVGVGVLGGTAFMKHPFIGIAIGLVFSFVLGKLIELIRKRKAKSAPVPPPGWRSVSAKRTAAAGRRSEEQAGCLVGHREKTPVGQVPTGERVIDCGAELRKRTGPRRSEPGQQLHRDRQPCPHHATTSSAACDTPATSSTAGRTRQTRAHGGQAVPEAD